jgi:hypothetical protein
VAADHVVEAGGLVFGEPGRYQVAVVAALVCGVAAETVAAERVAALRPNAAAIASGARTRGRKKA